MAPKRRRGSSWTRLKHCGAAEFTEEDAHLFAVMQSVRAQQQLVVSRQVYDLQDSTERNRLAQTVWSPEFILGSEGSLRELNPALSGLLDALTNNTYRSRADQCGEAQDKHQLHLEAILCAFVRMQSQLKTTLLCARFSIGAYRVHLPQAMWRMLHQVMPGLLASFRWTDDFLELAQSFRPPPNYEVLKGVGACMFDNYTRKALYSSHATTDSYGFSLDMTNSCSMAVPRFIAPAQFDALNCCKSPRRQQLMHS